MKAVLTTGLSISLVPSSIAQAFFQKFLSNVASHENNGIFYCDCEQELPDLWLLIEQDYWVQIRGSDMLTDVSTLDDRSICMINFLPSVDDFWVLGNTIYKDYYVYHNPE